MFAGHLLDARLHARLQGFLAWMCANPFRTTLVIHASPPVSLTNSTTTHLDQNPQGPYGLPPLHLGTVKCQSSSVFTPTQLHHTTPCTAPVWLTPPQLPVCLLASAQSRGQLVVLQVLKHLPFPLKYCYQLPSAQCTKSKPWHSLEAFLYLTLA